MGCSHGTQAGYFGRSSHDEPPATPRSSKPTNAHTSHFKPIKKTLAGAAAEQKEVPPLLQVITPNGQHACAGEYVLSSEETANGCPVWKLEGGSRWLFCSACGLWLIGGPDVRAANFARTAGFIYAVAAHGGVTPDQLAGAWRLWDGSCFKEDTAVKVTAGQAKEDILSVPSFVADALGALARIMTVNTPDVPLNDQKAPSLPNLGILTRAAAAASPRGASARSSMTGQRSPRTPPSLLNVQLPEAQRACAGLYELVPGELANGMALWKCRESERWLYSSRSGKWMICGADVMATGFDRAAAFVYSDRHGGAHPDQMADTWHWWDGAAFQSGGGVCVSAVLRRGPAGRGARL